MASVMCLHFNMQEKDSFDHTNAKCQGLGYIYVHYSQLVDHYVTFAYTS